HHDVAFGRTEDLEGLGGRSGPFYGESPFAQASFEELAHVAIVVDEQGAGPAHVTHLPGSRAPRRSCFDALDPGMVIVSSAYVICVGRALPDDRECPACGPAVGRSGSHDRLSGDAVGPAAGRLRRRLDGGYRSGRVPGRRRPIGREWGKGAV